MTLIDRARRRTGLADFGPEGPYEEGLTVLCRALEEEADLTPLGRLLARQMLVQALACQLQLQDWLARELRLSEYLMPGVQNMHRMGAALPQECVAITAQVFVSMQYNTIFRVPSYTRWLEHDADLATCVWPGARK